MTVTVNRRKCDIEVERILHIHMRRKHADIYMDGGEVIDTRTPYRELVAMVGENFIEVKRGSLVNSNAIHSITDRVNLNDGTALDYTTTAGRKREIKERLYAQRKKIIQSFSRKGIPASREEYAEYYKGFEFLPIAFTDIEMVFDDECCATDWVFCYGNQALAELEGVPLDRLVGSRFGDIFINMDEKWLRSYERAVLFGETLAINDYSPEIDADLNILCFPTFEGHCGCMLYEAGSIEQMGSIFGVAAANKVTQIK